MNACRFIETVPVYAQKIGNIQIDPSEFTHPDGAHIMDKTVICRTIADEGHEYCPRHEALLSFTDTVCT